MNINIVVGGTYMGGVVIMQPHMKKYHDMGFKRLIFKVKKK